MSKFDIEHLDEFAELLLLSYEAGLIWRTRFGALKLGALETYRPHRANITAATPSGIVIRDKYTYEELTRVNLKVTPMKCI